MPVKIPVLSLASSGSSPGTIHNHAGGRTGNFASGMFAKIFTQIFDSSIADDVDARHFFMDLLLLCDVEGVVDMTPSSISARTRIKIEEVNRLLKKLEEPDPQSRSHDKEGRRIALLPGRTWGWKVTNYQLYRDARSELDRRRIGNSEHYGGYVYFLSTTTDYGDIKIGFSINPWARASEVSASCPNGCVMIGQFKGGKDTESQWHERFKSLRKNGEWFTRSDELMTAIKEACGYVGTTVVTKKHRSTTPAMQKQKQRQKEGEKEIPPSNEKIGTAERITLEQSLKRAVQRLEDLKDADLPKFVEERRELKAEKQRILGLLGLKA